MARYFISYDFLTKDNRLGSGNAEFQLIEKINGSYDIEKIQDKILEDYPNYKKVVVKNFIELIDERKDSIIDVIQKEIDNIEGYGFQCEGGPLINCIDWMNLKKGILSNLSISKV